MPTRELQILQRVLRSFEARILTLVVPTQLVHKGVAVASVYSSLIAMREAGASVGAFTSDSPTPAERRDSLGGRLEDGWQ
jgi:hypothetical protein